MLAVNITYGNGIFASTNDVSIGHGCQDGEHITFHCPMHRRPRMELVGQREADTWEASDTPLLARDREEGRERYTGGTELFFAYLFAQLT